MRVISSDEERADWVPGIGGAGLGFGDEDSACDVSEIASSVELEPVPAITIVLPLLSLTHKSITF